MGRAFLMGKFQKFCINFLKVLIGIALILILDNVMAKFNWGNVDGFTYKLYALLGFSMLGGILTIKSKFSTKIRVTILLFIVLLTRLIWVLNVNSIPVSDYNAMYRAAKDLLVGNLGEFRDFGYLSRFPHLVFTTLYMALMIIIFPTSHLFAMKIVNVLLSVFSAFLIYKLSENFIKHERVRLGTILLTAIFPAFISYTSTYCTENMAIPLYLLTMLIFFNSVKTNDLGKWFLCGVLLSISNLFRGVGVVFLIAFLIYICIFTKEDKIKNSLILSIAMIFTTIFVSLFLISINIIDKPLWKGAEPSFATLLLKGTNVENGGRWNVDDDKFVKENLGDSNLTKKCVEMATNRISALSLEERISFFKNKFVSQWSVGDFSGTYWAFLEVDQNRANIIPSIFQIVFIVFLMLTILSLFKTNADNNVILHIFLCGFGLLFMIIETQARYSYIISWVFIILGACGIEVLIDLLRRIKNVKVFSKNDEV